MIIKNIYANLLGRVWSFISVYLFIPLYLRYLGIEAYGLIGFYSTLLGILAFADLGFTAALNREMARLSVRNDSDKDMRDLLRTYEWSYALISVIQSLLLWFLAPVIAEHWLRSNTLEIDEIAMAIRLMGVAIALQLPAGLYIGGLMGLQRQVRANVLQVAWGAFRGVGAVLVLWLYSPTIVAFSAWQVISNAIYCFLARQDLWGTVMSEPAKDAARFNMRVYRKTWRYASGILGLSIVSTLLRQTDKLAVSKMLPLEMLGYYTLASAIAMAPLALASPIGLAVFPRLTGLVEMKNHSGLIRLYHRTCEVTALAIIPGGITLAFFSREFIYAWTGSSEIAIRAGPVSTLLILGQISQSVSLIPYYLSLAHGKTRLLMSISFTGLILMIPLLYLLIMGYGLKGAGMSWLLMNLLTITPYMYFLHRQLLPGEGLKWLMRGVVRPLFATLPCVSIAHWLLPQASSRLLEFGKIGLVWAIAILAAVLVSSDLRREIVHQMSRLFARLKTILEH